MEFEGWIYCDNCGSETPVMTNVPSTAWEPNGFVYDDEDTCCDCNEVIKFRVSCEVEIEEL